METIFGVPAGGLLSVLLFLLGIILAAISYVALRYPLPFRLGLRNLRRRKSQTALIVGGLALSTVIITSALGIGDTVEYSVRSGVYESLGAIDEEIGVTAVEQTSSFGFGAGGSALETALESEDWFDSAVAKDIGGLVDEASIDGVAPAIIQKLPVINNDSNLSEGSVELRGIGNIIGDGLLQPAGLDQLSSGQVVINDSLAVLLDANVGDELLLVWGMNTPTTVAEIIPDGELAGSKPALLWPLEKAQSFLDRPDQITAIFVSNAGDAESGVDNTDAVVSQLEVLVSDLNVSAVKADQLAAASASAEFITTLFVTFGMFSIFSGILLIFLIFSVLAAERRSELGMGRAVGLQQSDLVRQFVTEGFSYNFVAAIIGASLGVLISLILAGTITGLLGASDLNITPRVSPRSVTIGYSLGLIISFVTIAISALRISRVNIIAAIRDLDLPSLPRESQWTLFLHPFTVWRAALRTAGQGNNREAVRLFLLAGPEAVTAFWLGLLARGPVLMVLGYLFAWIGVNVAGQSGVYGLGVSLFLVGLGQLASWLLFSDRVAYSLVGLSLILYWTLPTREAGRLAELEGGPADFFISGIFLVGGAIMLFLYNADSLLNIFAGFLSRLGRLLPVARVSVAYPVKAKGRTATTLAMFSLVVFTLVGTITITNTFSSLIDSETGSGGYDLLVQTNLFNPLSSDEIAMTVDELVTSGLIARPEAIASVLFSPVQAQSPNMNRPATYAINAIDDAFFESQNLELAGIAKGYDSEDQVWAAIQRDPSLIVIDNLSVDRAGDPTFELDEDAFIVSSISASDPEFEPQTVQITGVNGSTQEFIIVGVLGTAPSFFGAMMSAEAAASLELEGANRYFLRLSDGTDAREAANSIESELTRSGVQTTLLKEQLDASRQTVRSIFYLIQGFIGLGLLIGIAALGVITIRAVVERRQQIGVLRAIGFQRHMVQGVFLFEGVFIAGLGTVIGYVLALAFAYNLYLQVAADQGVSFQPPWPVLLAIAVLVVAASLLTAWLPARATAKVTIAEALRYE